jgi:hypothetical protein
MGEIVNLRRHRKLKDREAREAAAAENRVRFGRTKAEKAFDRSKQREAESFLDQGRLERDGSDGDRD